MRDGVRLSANVYRPAGSARCPTVLLRTPYDKSPFVPANFKSFLDRGYAIVIEDVRGRYQSEGVFEPVNQEINDGDDTLNWIARQPWSDGNVGMYGGSYLGIAQWKAALSHNPHLKAIFPYVSGDDDYRDRFYSIGGAMKLGHRLLWVEENMRASGYTAPPFRELRLDAAHATPISAATGHRSRSGRNWQPSDLRQVLEGASVREHLKDIRVPVYSVGGWYDNYVESDLDAFTTLSKLNPEVRIMIGPWPHVFTAPFANVDFGKDSLVPLRPEQLKWFDRWVKGIDAPDPQARVRIFVMGANKWRDEDEWPLGARKQVEFYLGARRPTRR